MRRLVIVNQKGGVGKTTTTANLAAALVRRGWRVLLIDMDPQAHLSIHFGFDPESNEPTIYDVLTQGTSVTEILRDTEEGLRLLPACVDLAAAEVELAGVDDRHYLLRNALSPLENEFDAILVDCAPSLGLLTLNALCAGFEVIIPLQPHFLALQGLMKLGQTVALVRARLNPMLRIAGVVVVMQDTGTLLSAEVISGLEQILAAHRRSGDAWGDARIFSTRIRRNIKLAECPSHQTSIFTYAPKSNGALDYAALADELFGTAAAAPVAPADAAPPVSAATTRPTHNPRDAEDAAPSKPSVRTATA
ncbi:MAG: chromosome partitioning protein ParA [Planctomycetota bacterium]|nr:MAG: chromosome partitioning protein ParA [Planctomycetota bacterium]